MMPMADAEQTPTFVDKGAAPLADGYAVRLYPIDSGDEVRLADLWRVAWRGRWRIIVAGAGGAILALIATFLITPEYRAETVLAPVSAARSSSGLASIAGQLGGLAALAGINLGAQDNTAEAVAILQSRALTERFIQKNNLLPVLFPDEWDAAKARWAVDDPDDVPRLWQGFERFDKSIRTVNQEPETGLVRLTIDWTNPAQASEWANGLVDEVNADMRGRAIAQSRKNIEFLRGQLQSTNELELRTAVFGLVEAEMKNAMLAAVRTEFAFEVIDPAVVPEKVYWPNRILLAAVGLFAGLLIGVIAVFIRGRGSLGA
jgi:uncharacterized protein involved in exopolysaccharide biosynthesis